MPEWLSACLSECLSACLHQVNEMLSNYANSRRGFLLVVRGESGMGKSKLVEEVESYLAPEQNVIPIEVRAMATESSGQLFVWKGILQVT